MPEYDEQYYKEVRYAENTFSPKVAKEMKKTAKARFHARHRAPMKGSISKRSPKKRTSKLSAALGSISKVAKSAKDISKDMGRAIVYELNAPPPKRLKTKKKSKPKRKPTARVAKTPVCRTIKPAKPRAATKPPAFVIKPEWM